MIRTTSERGIRLIEEFEGLRLRAYHDAVGILTIGYGHTGDVTEGQTITREEAETLLKHDVSSAEVCVNRAAPGLTQNQFDACVSFVYNIGCGAFQNSTLLKQIRAGEWELAAGQFGKWVRAGGRTLPGLIKRRAAESDLFLTPDEAVQ